MERNELTLIENRSLKSIIKKQDTKYNKLLRAFNELLDEYIIELERRGEDTDDIRLEYFEKAEIID